MMKMKMKLLHLMIVPSLFACRNNQESTLDAVTTRTLPVFTDAAHEGIALKQWPLDNTEIQQAVVPSEGRGFVWDIKTNAFGVAHAQFNSGAQSVTPYQRIKFDMRVVKAESNDLIVKLGGIYPARAELKLNAASPAAAAECASVQAVIDNAIRAGELEVLKQSSDPLIAKCAAGSGSSGWRSYSVEFKDLAVIDGFKMDAANDPFVIELGRGMHIQLDNIRLEGQSETPTTTAPPAPGVNPPSGAPSTFASLGSRAGASIVNNVAVTDGVIRVRRRHENDMDFGKFNPFYWQGRLTNFKVEDFTVAGENRIKFSMKTEWPQDYTANRGPDFSAIYIGDPSAPSETTRSKFAINMRMAHISDFRNFEAVIGPGEFAAFPQLKKGTLLVFEFRFFNNESFPEWQKQKATNPHNLSAYYSEFFRIRIGEPGLYIDNLADSNAMPDPARYNGGWGTLPTTRVEPWKALQQLATNLSFANMQNFFNGRTWFHTDMTTGQHVADDADDKPSVFFEDMRLSRAGYAASTFNVRSCNACHVNNGIAMLPGEGAAVHKTVVKTLNKQTGLAHAQFGEQLQTDGVDSEGSLKLARYETTAVALNDGTTITLKKPIFSIDNPAYPVQDLVLSPRKPPAMIGMGLLDAVPEDQIRALAAQTGGKFRTINGKIGRFGWKAGQVSLQSQITGALVNDMGVTSNSRPTLDCGTRCKPGKAQLPDVAVKEINAYISLLGVPARNNPNDPQVLRGETVFKQLGCQTCHVQTLRTGPSELPEVSNQTIQAFTDLLLHDMGPGLADADQGEFARSWRTAPLWGLKNVKHATNSRLAEFPAGNINLLWNDAHRVANTNPIQLLHDGRAGSIPEAILWHGGEADAAVKLYKALSKSDRDALEAFLWDL